MPPIKAEYLSRVHCHRNPGNGMQTVSRISSCCSCSKRWPKQKHRKRRNWIGTNPISRYYTASLGQLFPTTEEIDEDCHYGQDDDAH